MSGNLTNLSKQFVEAMAAAASGVSVVTTDGAHGRFVPF